jgi:chorismate dehydratase
LRQGPVRLLDIGFGLGINCRAALDCAEGAALQIDTLELEPEALERGLLVSPEDPMILSLLRSGQFEGVQLHMGDLRQTLQRLSGPYDVIFHDPFSPLKNTEAWTVEVFRLLKEKTAPDGLLATYSESTLVRSALAEAGWQVGTSEAVPPHRSGTLAALDKQQLTHPLNPDSFKTEPYRDPDFTWNGKRIRSEREAVVRSSRP